MKIAMAVVTALISSSAFACPSFQGIWTCKSSQGTTDVTSIQESAIPGGMLYSITDRSSGKVDQIYADGKARPVTDHKLSGTVTAACTNATTVTMKEHLASADKSVVADVTNSVLLLNQRNFVIKMTIVVGQTGKPTHSQAASATCVRQ
jgi:hypothetical protein